MGDRRLGEGRGGAAERRGRMGRRGRGPPAKLSSLPTAIEKVKHTPTGGHVTIGEKDRSSYLPHFRAQPTAVVYFAHAERYMAREDKREGKKPHLDPEPIGGSRARGFTRKEIDSSEKRSLSRFKLSIARSSRNSVAKLRGFFLSSLKIILPLNLR